MPVLRSKTKREFALMLTHECNWHCKYCAVNNQHDRGLCISESSILSKLARIPPKSAVTLFGGEPGLADRVLVEKCISILEAKQCKLYLETNGTFMWRYPDLLVHFHEVLYHCSQDLDEDDQIVQTSFSRVRYLVVVHDDNINKLQKFLDLHEDIKFDIIEATYPYPDEMDGPRLSRESKRRLVSDFASRMTAESLYRLLNGKDFEGIDFLDD